jgi:GNAT superfamily N-acetyltransferase
MAMVIRGRRPDDLHRCVEVLAQVHAADGYPLRWPADPKLWLTPEHLLAAWVAERDGALAGHVALCDAIGDAGADVWMAASGLAMERLGVIAKLFVAPIARGRGMGATLLNTACAEARGRGMRPALEVLDSDRSAIALYERTGWRRLASVPVPWASTDDGQALLHYYLAPDWDAT